MFRETFRRAHCYQRVSGGGWINEEFGDSQTIFPRHRVDHIGSAVFFKDGGIPNFVAPALGATHFGRDQRHGGPFVLGFRFEDQCRCRHGFPPTLPILCQIDAVAVDPLGSLSRDRVKEIVRLVKEAEADLLVVGAHRHRGLKDYLFGETIDAVRHDLDIAILIINVYASKN